MLNGKAIQLLAQLGYNHFKSFIQFIGIMLRNCRNQYKQAQRQRKRNCELREKCRKFGNNLNRKPIREQHNRHSTLRSMKQIDDNFKEHAKNVSKTTTTLIDEWISYKFRTQPFLFKDNSMLAIDRQREFNRQNKELWISWKRDKKRLKNLTLNSNNRRQSFRDLQAQRNAVKITVALYNAVDLDEMMFVIGVFD